MGYTDRALAFLAARDIRPPSTETGRERSERGERSQDRSAEDRGASTSRPSTSTVGVDSGQRRSSASESASTAASCSSGRKGS